MGSKEVEEEYVKVGKQQRNREKEEEKKRNINNNKQEIARLCSGRKRKH